MPPQTGPIGSSPGSSAPTTAPSAPFGVPVAVTNQTASWSVAVDAVALLPASGITVNREIGALADGAAPQGVASVDAILGMQVVSRQIDELVTLSHQVLAAARLRIALFRARGVNG